MHNAREPCEGSRGHAEDDGSSPTGHVIRPFVIGDVYVYIYSTMLSIQLYENEIINIYFFVVASGRTRLIGLVKRSYAKIKVWSRQQVTERFDSWCHLYLSCNRMFKPKILESSLHYSVSQIFVLLLGCANFQHTLSKVGGRIVGQGVNFAMEGRQWLSPM